MTAVNCDHATCMGGVGIKGVQEAAPESNRDLVRERVHDNLEPQLGTGIARCGREAAGMSSSKEASEGE